MGARKVRATEVTCDSCHAIQVVTDPLDIIGYSGTVCEQAESYSTGSVKWFACTKACIESAVTNAIMEAYES